MIKEQIAEFFKGEISDDTQTLDKYSRDASLLKVTPKIVLFPKDVTDLKNLVQYVRESKKSIPELSITGRSAGTDMGGGPLNESIILDFTSHFKYKKVDVENLVAEVEPGVFSEILKQLLFLNIFLFQYIQPQNNLLHLVEWL